MDILIFNGNYHKWVSFKDIFKQSIHSNHSMSKAQKMQFLKSKVKIGKGDPEQYNYTTCANHF